MKALTATIEYLFRPVHWARYTVVPSILGGLIGAELAIILILRLN